MLKWPPPETEEHIMKYIWNGPGNISIGSRLHPPGEELELTDGQLSAMAESTRDGFSESITDATQKDDDPDPAPAPKKRRGRKPRKV